MSNARRNNTWHRSGRGHNRRNSTSTRASCTGWASCDCGWTCSRPTGSLHLGQGGRRRRRPPARSGGEPWRERHFQVQLPFEEALAGVGFSPRAHSLTRIYTIIWPLAGHPRAHDTNMQNLHLTHGTGHRDRRDTRDETHSSDTDRTESALWVQHSPLIISRNICG